MRYLQVLTMLLILPIFAIAQETEGEIRYKQTIKLDIKIDGEMSEQLKAMIPSSRAFKKVLYFNTTEALYKDVNPEEDKEEVIENESEEGTVRIKMVRASAENKQYTGLKDKTNVESKDFMGRKFLVTGKAKTFKWKLTQDTKKIGEYTCTKATTKEDSTMYEAWFTMQIPVAVGPDRFNGLPGLILEVRDTKGKNVIQATKVDLKKLEQNTIVKPTKGKKVTEAEFKAIVEKKTKQMMEQNGGNGRIMRFNVRN